MWCSLLCGPNLLALYLLLSINKKNSQKDAEQKKSGNYFFYDDGADDDGDEIDDFDL